MTRIAYLSWPAREISGGIKMAFRHVEALRELGFSACVATPDAAPPAWFQTSAPVVSFKGLARADDVLVFPENHAGFLKEFISWPNRKVVFCQNQYKIHRGLEGREDYRAYGIQHVICPGHLSATHCRRRLPRDNILIVPYPIDRTLFCLREPKKIQIAFSPRKRAEELLVVYDLFRAENPQFRSIPWVEITRMSESDVARVLGESVLYLSLLRFEALPLSALEALACGCLVAGFTGFGGRDYATASNGFWAPEDDCCACVDQLTLATRVVFEERDRHRAMVREGLRTVDHYDRENFKSHLRACWNTILNGPAG